jgi:hypothetical protein
MEVCHGDASEVEQLQRPAALSVPASVYEAPEPILPRRISPHAQAALLIGRASENATGSLGILRMIDRVLI